MNDERDRHGIETDHDERFRDAAGMLGLGIALGVGVGSVVEVVLDNLALGMGVGIALRAGIGAALSARK